MGTLLLGATVGALAWGTLSTHEQVLCAAPAPNQNCPSSEVVSRSTSRPFLVPSMGLAALLGGFGAFDAYRAANRINASRKAAAAERDRPDRVAAGPRIVPTVSGVGVELLRVQF